MSVLGTAWASGFTFMLALAFVRDRDTGSAVGLAALSFTLLFAALHYANLI